MRQNSWCNISFEFGCCPQQFNLRKFCLQVEHIVLLLGLVFIVRDCPKVTNQTNGTLYLSAIFNVGSVKGWAIFPLPHPLGG